MKREDLKSIKHKVISFKEAARDMQTISNKCALLPKGQFKKLIDDEFLEILKKYGTVL